MGSAVVNYSRIALGLVFCGVVSGVIWSNQHRREFFPTEARRSARPAHWLWLIFAAIAQQLSRGNGKMLSLIAITGSAVVTLGWFGALLDAARTNS